MFTSETGLNAAWGVFVFLYGISMGSFLSAVAYRLPRGISLVRPRSFCPSCKTQISPHRLIPLFGYFFNKRRCSACNVKIPPLDVLVELLTGLGTLFLFFHFLDPLALGASQTQTLSFLTALFLFYVSIPLTLIDFAYRILPDIIVLPATPAAFFLAAFNPALGWEKSLIGLAVGGGGLYLCAILYRILRRKEGMGLGDVKYLGLIGAALGWQGAFLSLFIASIMGSIFGIAYGLKSRTGLSTSLPFGPFLAMGALTTSIWSHQIFSLLGWRMI